MSRIYIVTDRAPEQTGERRLVRADTRAQVRAHLAERWLIEPASADAAVDLVGRGVSVEDAGQAGEG